MRPFDFFAPTTLVEALELLDQYKEKATVIAGGTDLIIELNEKIAKPEVVVDLKHVAELNYIKVENGVCHIGSMTTHGQIAADETIKKNVSILYDACRQVGSPQIRNLATIGGNICQSSVAGDGFSACVNLNVTLVLVSKDGKREVSIRDFINTGDRARKNDLRIGEILTELYFPLPDTKHTATAFYKLGKRKALAISVIGGGMVVTVDDNGVCTECTMRAGALGRYPMHLKTSEEYLVGKKLSFATMLETLPLMHDQVLEANKARPWSVFYKKESVQGVYKHLFADILRKLNIEEVQGF